MTEVGTLKEFDVKPGDVVEYMWHTGEWKRGTVDVFGIVQMDDGGRQNPQYSADPNWRIISRASETPKLWRDMTDAEKGALLLADHDGKVIEWKCGDTWFGMKPSWVDYIAYRVRPEPKVEVVTMYAASNMKGFGPTRGVKSAYQITFNTIDGKPDTASIKMEAL